MSQQAWRVVEPVIEAMGYECVGTEYLSQGGRNTLRVYIDTPAGVTLADCEAVSHQLDGVLDVEDPLGGVAYDLEVSSPGLDRPLFKPADFTRFAGERVKIRTSVPQDGRRNYTGKLLGIDGGTVRVEVDNQVYELVFEQIERARLVPRF